MNKQINKIIILSVLALIMGFVSCTDGFDDINTSLDTIIPPGNETEGFGDGIHLGDSITPEEYVRLQANINNIGTVFKNLSYEGLYNNYQITTNLTHDIYAGYFANFNPVWINGTPSYMYAGGWSDTRWNQFYLNRTAEYGELARAYWFVGHDFETGTGTYLNAFYITRIYYAFLISMQTDTYGDMPLTDLHLQGLNSPDAPEFKTQEEVYDIIFALLDDALTNIDPNDDRTLTQLGLNDRCYGGDVTKWIRFGNTLRLRLALRISNVDPEKAKEQGEAALAHPVGLIISDEDNMKTIPKYAPIALGGENSGGDENIHALCSYKWYDCGLNADLEYAYRNLSDFFDPRCEISWYRPLADGSNEEMPIEKDEDFKGSKTGEQDIQKPSFIHSLLRSHGADSKALKDDAWFGYSRESVWLSYAESRFLLAEAAVRDWAGVTDSPLNYTLEGIRASLRYYKITYFQELIYMSGLKFMKDSSTNPFMSNDKEGMLEQIITHKWVAVFPNGNEGWAEFRRTDYPSFISLPLSNTSGGDVPNGKFIKRINYPSDEIALNPHAQHVPSGTRLWWDVADANDASGNRIKPNNFR
ncbi:SusD/RagB family nutrient-binding outer membrane lipoprotein [Bacteroidales bacterium OttesenSCG-928-I14]|nr:SusD/RagB family nutrient-binding outer membrane lipoprotein [Bacteroidales bacterium OttesenSCG-928-I14]